MLELKFKGTNKEIGGAHGEELRAEINQTLNLYLDLWKKPLSEIPDLVEGFRSATENYFPKLDEEIKSIAEGSNLDVNLIYAINSRTELLSNINLNECTAVGVDEFTKVNYDVVLGQNWDWMNNWRNLTRIVEINSRIKMLIEPGMVGKIGMNADGLGLCLNYLPTFSVNKTGIPVHILMRGILENKDSKSVAELIKNSPRAASANYLVGDKGGNICSFETTPEIVSEIWSDKFVTHTNSFNSQGELCKRQTIFEDALRNYIRQSRKLLPQDLKKAFKLEGVQAPITFQGGIETIHTIIMNLTKKRMLVSEGAKSDEFSCYYFEVK
ncbi:hypothetical protein HZA97_08115 [Candidatus Woesearchaeota archaeon]|nr:hypothetical protein [Candidatus Woesearchaeota archaeon]